MHKETTAPELHRIGYLSVIDASPTNLDVIYTMLMRSLETTNEVHDVEDKVPVIIVTDQAANCQTWAQAKALEICSFPAVAGLERIILRMGAFHVVLNVFAVVGNRFGSAGLDTLIEASVFASVSVDAVLEERHYNWGLWVHKLVSEALERMGWSAFRK